MRDPRYQRLLNSREWQDTKRIVWQRAGGLCEECASKGYVRAGKDCHHIVPVETGKTIQEMERLCFDWEHNIKLLCVPCHVAIHQQMHKGTKANRSERQGQRLARFMDSVRGNSTTKTTTETSDDPSKPAPVVFPETGSDSKISLPSSESREQLLGRVLFPES